LVHNGLFDESRRSVCGPRSTDCHFLSSTLEKTRLGPAKLLGKQHNGGEVMSTVIRLLIGLGLFTFGFHLGREVGRMEPYIDELDQARRRRGVTIDGESTSEDEK